MLSYQRIVGMPVLSLDDGTEIGTIRQAVIDGAQGKVVALAIDNHRWWRPCRIALLEDVVGVGDKMLTVATASRLFMVADRPEFEQLVTDERRLLGTQAYTRGGELAGTVTGYSFERATGRILSLELERPDADRGESNSLDYQRVLVLGRDVVIVADDPWSAQHQPPAAQNDSHEISTAPEIAQVDLPGDPAGLDEPTEQHPAETDHVETADAFQPLYPLPVVPPVPDAEPQPEQPVAAEAAPARTILSFSQFAARSAPSEATPAVEAFKPAVVTPAPVEISPTPAPAVSTPVASAVEQPQAIARPVLTMPPAATTAAPVPEPVAPPVATDPPVAVFAPAPAPEAAKPAPASGGTSTGADLARLFRERQERFLLGKVAQRPVRDDTGATLVDSGQEVDQFALDLVKEAGKLLELTASVSLRR